RIEQLTRCKDSDSLSGAIEDALSGFDDKRRREGIDVAAPRDRAACIHSISNDHVYQEDLRRTSRIVARFGRRGGGIAKIAQRRQVEVGMEMGGLENQTRSTA